MKECPISDLYYAPKLFHTADKMSLREKLISSFENCIVGIDTINEDLDSLTLGCESIYEKFNDLISSKRTGIIVDCYSCSKKVEFGELVIKFTCGHGMHQSCMNDSSNKGCRICSWESIEGKGAVLYDIFSTITELDRMNFE